MTAVSHITEQDLREAASVTSRMEGAQFEIQLGHLCNDRCVFCSSGQLTQLKRARSIPLDPIVEAIEQARAGGARRITFLGGEPTLHKGFLKALQRSVELGFDEIVIFTNGVLLPHPGFIDKVVALGRFEWRISIQGATEEAHVAVTGRKDSFRRIIDGLKILKSRNQDVTANICVNERSYRSLPEFPSLVRQHGVRQLHLDIVRPSSTGERTEEYLRDIMPRYSVMAPSMREMLARFDREAPGFDVNIGNLPFCILPDWADKISHGGERTVTKSCGDGALEVAVDKYDWHVSMRRHVPACEPCAFRTRCTGIFTTYLELYGDREFQPVSLETLRGLDRASHAFVFLVEPWAAALENATLPAGWTLSHAVRDSRGRRVDVHLRDPEQRAAILRLEPTDSTSEDAAVLVTDQFVLRHTADPAVGVVELLSLLDWAGRTLGAIPGAKTLAPQDLAAVAAEHSRRHLADRGRLRVEELVRRVEARRHFGTWEATGHRDEGADSIVELVGPEGRIEVVFTVRAQNGRPRVALDARPGVGVHPTLTHSVVRDLAAAIQDPSAIH